jgi:hypothetical protein
MQMTSQEKVLFSYTKKFHLEHGASEEDAEREATEKIIKTRSLVKTLKFRH